MQESNEMQLAFAKSQSFKRDESMSSNWYEVRTSSQTPERRSYHSTFTYDNKMYVMGGLDIQNGSMPSLWELDLGSASELDQNDSHKPSVWTLKKTQETKQTYPGPVAYHTTCVCKD